MATINENSTDSNNSPNENEEHQNNDRNTVKVLNHIIFFNWVIISTSH